jgi:sortase A
MRRALGTLLVLAGLLVLADAAVTLAWQEPVSALRAGRSQHRLAAQLHALELAAPRHGRDGARLAEAARALMHA